MKKNDVEQAVFEIVRAYGKVLKGLVKRTFIIPESRLPYSKKVIKNAIRVALLVVDDKDMIEHLKASYTALANFVSEEEAKKTEEISQDLFSFLEMEEDKKKEFIRQRVKSGLLGDYERALEITKKIIDEQKQLKQEIEELTSRPSST